MDRHATQSNTRRQYSEADSFNRAIKGPRMTQVTGMAHTITYFTFLYTYIYIFRSLFTCRHYYDIYNANGKGLSINPGSISGERERTF